jgi:uroporphyrinogen III methyltransferase/synthase
MSVTVPVDTARPLAGRVVLVTRARAQAGRFRSLLEAAGARVLTVPAIAIEAPESWAPLDRALAALDSYHWVVFTSVNGVEMARRRLDPGALRVLATRRVAAIGPATAEALAALGVAAELVPDEYVAEGLVAALRPHLRAGDRVLLPRAARTRDVLVRELEALGARVDEVAAYRTRPAAEDAGPVREALARGGIDVATFTSSSTVSHFAALFAPGELGRLMAGVTVACIGPITRATAAEHGLVTHVMPGAYTIPALADAIAAHYAEKGP